MEHESERGFLLEADLTGSQFDVGTLWELAQVLKRDVIPQLETGRRLGAIHDAHDRVIGSWTTNGRIRPLAPRIPGTSIPELPRAGALYPDQRIRDVDRLLAAHQPLPPAKVRRAVALRDKLLRR